MPSAAIAFTGDDPGLLASAPVGWAIDRLNRVTPGNGSSPVATVILDRDDRGHETYRMRPDPAATARIDGDPVGLRNAISELADKIDSGADPVEAVTSMINTEERPAMPVRSLARSFSSVDEDLPWFRDRDFWTEYLDWLAASRFGRFHLALGMQYNYGADPHGATDNYLCFAYPFLLDVDGYDVHAEGVDTSEQRRNLEALQFISAETKRRGMHFQLGLWNHAYDYGRDSDHRFPITGLTPQTHADYSAAALAQLLTLCPDIDGLTFRVHYEGGIADHAHEIFWETIFTGASSVGRDLEIDMHAKGVDQALIDAVDKPHLRPVLSAKYWAEHMGLPYHQTSIRARETARPIPPGHELKGITEFSRRFTRYGYADFLAEDRQTDLIFRVWPGTQKLLLWGDPAIAAGYGRLATFGGSRGVDICEPLYFKGRKGSGEPGGRDPYVDPDLQLGGREWKKYRYSYLLWGRLLYNPDTAPEVWRRFLRSEYGDRAEAVERALSPLSRILPLITVVHGVGGSNNGNWPELYVNLPISTRTDPAHYAFDTEQPPVWGTVSPFDPTLFSIINEYADDVLAGNRSAKYTPLEVAGWLEGLVAAAEPSISTLSTVSDPDPQLRRTMIDIEVLARLGRFFAGKFRAAVAYALFERTGDRRQLTQALEHYRTAREQYADIPRIVDGVYQTDLRFGPESSEHGHWSTRIPGIDGDIANLEAELAAALGDPAPDLPEPGRRRPAVGVRHLRPDSFDRGADLSLQLQISDDAEVTGAVLHYRHVDQSDTFRQLIMESDADGLVGTIPADYTDSSFPLMYYFELLFDDGSSTIFPGLAADLSNQPYVAIFSSSARPPRD